MKNAVRRTLGLDALMAYVLNVGDILATLHITSWFWYQVGMAAVQLRVEEILAAVNGFGTKEVW